MCGCIFLHSNWGVSNWRKESFICTLKIQLWYIEIWRWQCMAATCVPGCLLRFLRHTFTLPTELLVPFNHCRFGSFLMFSGMLVCTAFFHGFPFVPAFCPCSRAWTWSWTWAWTSNFATLAWPSQWFDAQYISTEYDIVRLEHFDFHVHRRQLQFLSVPQQKRKDMQKHFEAPWKRMKRPVCTLDSTASGKNSHHKEE